MSRTQYGYVPTNLNNNQFTTEFQGNSIGQNPYQQNSQFSSPNQGYSMQNVNDLKNETSFQNYMDKSFNTGATSEGFTDAAGAIPGYGTAIQAVDSVLGPVQDDLMSINQETGAFDDMNDASWGEAMGTMLDPGSHAMDTFQDPDASSGEKALSALNVIFPGLGNIGSKSRLEEDEKKNIALADEAKKEEQMVLNKRIQDEVRRQRLSSYQQNDPQYGSVFKYGGTINRYANGGDVKEDMIAKLQSANPIVNSVYSQNNPNAVSYNTPHPFQTAEGQEYYLTPTTVAMQGNDAFKQFNNKYSYYTDPKLVYDYGNVRGVNYNPQSGMHYNTDHSGDYQKMMNAYSKKLKSEDLDYKEMKNGGSLESIENNPLATYYSNGGTHETNKLGGIPIGNNSSVEEGEFKYKDFIFTNRF